MSAHLSHVLLSVVYSAACCGLKSITQVNRQPFMLINFSLSHAGSFKGMCKQIDHFPEDADYEADASEYFLRESSLHLLLKVQ